MGFVKKEEMNMRELLSLLLAQSLAEVLIRFLTSKEILEAVASSLPILAYSKLTPPPPSLAQCLTSNKCKCNCKNTRKV